MTPAPSPTLNPSEPRRIGRTLARGLAWTLAIAALIQPVATRAGSFDAWLDLVSHFQEPALLVTILGCLAMARVHRGFAVGLALLGVGQAWTLTSYNGANPVPPDPRTPDRLRILVVNVLTDNLKRDPLIRLIQAERPDIVGMLEVSSDWLDGLEAVRTEFPYRWEYPAEDAKGLALWSRKPPIAIEPPTPLAPGGNPALHATINFAARGRSLWLVHNVSPFERPANMPLGAEFDALSLKVRGDSNSTIVVGDMNSTDGSTHFRRFLRTSGLRDARLGFGRARSWPEWSWYRLAIDHTFLSADLAVVSRRVGPDIGSDHFPILLDLAPAARPSTNEAAQLDHSSVESGSAPANLVRSAFRRKSTSLEACSGPIRSPSVESASISSVVLEAQDGP